MMYLLIKSLSQQVYVYFLLKVKELRPKAII